MKKRKSFKEYWKLIDIPVVLFILYALVTLIFPLADFLGNVVATIVSFVVLFAVFGFIGFKVFEEKAEHPGKVGAYAGAIIGLASAILSIIAFYLFPSVFTESIQSAVQSGADLATVRTFMQVGLFVGLVLNPAIYAGIGAALTLLSNAIFKKVRKKK